MYNITDQQIDFILGDIRARGVEMEDLQYNLLDHVCCIIEQNLEVNGDFERFYQKTIRQFYKNELWEIEEETISLQLFKHYYTMKKIMIGSGVFAAVLMTAGIFFKFMHWPGASALLILGIGSSSLVFLPLLFTLKMREKKQTRDKLVIGIGTLAGILMSLGILFKIMHWPGANMMGLGSVLIMMVLFLPVYFFAGIRNPETKVNTIISTILIIMGCGLFFTLVNVRPSIKIQNNIDFANEHIANSYDFLTEQNVKTIAAESNDSIAGKKNTGELSRQCNDLCKTIGELKLKIVFAVEGKQVSKINYRALTAGDNFDIPTDYLFDNKGNPKQDLRELKKKLVALNELAEGFSVKASRIINLADQKAVHRDGMESWEVSNFHQAGMIMVLQNFTQLQLDIRIVEASCLATH